MHAGDDGESFHLGHARRCTAHFGHSGDPLSSAFSLVFARSLVSSFSRSFRPPSPIHYVSGRRRGDRGLATRLFIGPPRHQSRALLLAAANRWRRRDGPGVDCGRCDESDENNQLPSRLSWPAGARKCPPANFECPKSIIIASTISGVRVPLFGTREIRAKQKTTVNQVGAARFWAGLFFSRAVSSGRAPAVKYGGPDVNLAGVYKTERGAGGSGEEVRAEEDSGRSDERSVSDGDVRQRRKGRRRPDCGTSGRRPALVRGAPLFCRNERITYSLCAASWS